MLNPSPNSPTNDVATSGTGPAKPELFAYTDGKNLEGLYHDRVS